VETIGVIESRLTGKLRVFLGAVFLVFFGSLAVRCWPTSCAAAVARLCDGDLEHSARLSLLQQVCAEPNEASGADSRQLARVMAAIALNVDLPFRKACGAERHWPFALLPNAAILDTAALGDPVLKALLAAMVSESRGDLAAAQAGYEQVVRSSYLFRMPLAQQLAAAGKERTH
jgi:hypothetical protein